MTVCRDSPTVLTRDTRSGTEVSSLSLDVHRSEGRGVEVSIRNTPADDCQRPSYCYTLILRINPLADGTPEVSTEE